MARPSTTARLLATGGQDGALRVWSLQDGRAPTLLQGQGGAVYGVAVSPDGRTIASCCLDGTVMLWDVERGRLVARLKGHTGALFRAGCWATCCAWRTRGGPRCGR